MRYDDRLATVLRLTPAGPGVARAQFRQLIDLLGTRPVDEHGEMIDHAYIRLAELGARLPVEERAAILRQGGLRLRSPRLVAAMATREWPVAQAAVQAAQLDESQWVDLIPALPLASRGLLRARTDLGPEARALLARLGIGDTALPEAAAEAALPAQPAPQPGNPSRDGDIGALVRRIEAFRQAREHIDPAQDAPLLPLEEAHSLRILTSFDFASDAEGRIVWAESPVAPMVVGHVLGAVEGSSGAVKLHQPLRGLQVELKGAPATAGEWQVDAMPRFDPLGGRFVGYLGRFRRPAEASPTPQPRGADSEADRLRQLLHELRTPVNAIQGFAEVIQQQLFGPAPHEYRALAATIAADAARVLAGFEELDRLAKLGSGTLELERGEADLAAIVAATAGRLQPPPHQPGARLALAVPAARAPVRLAPVEAERLVWRLLSTLCGNAAADEMLAVSLNGTTLHLALPRALAGLDDAVLYHAAGEGAAGMFGTGFALRLACAEARAAGGELRREGAMLALALPDPARPDLTIPTPPPSKVASVRLDPSMV